MSQAIDDLRHEHDAILQLGQGQLKPVVPIAIDDKLPGVRACGRFRDLTIVADEGL